MIAKLRARHRTMWIILAVVLLVILVGGHVVKSDVPTDSFPVMRDVPDSTALMR